MILIAYLCESRFSTIFMCAICGHICCCHAGDHPCTIDYQLEIDLTVRRHQDERLVPDLTNSKQIHCSWLFKAPRLKGKRALLLEGISNRSESDENSSVPAGSQIQYELHDPTSECTGATVRRNVTPGLFCVLPLTDRRTYLTASLNRRREELEGPKPTVLRAMTPLTGFCSRDMLSFKENCYAISPVKERLSESMHSIMGQAQLASFKNLSVINQLFDANEKRLNSHPYERPLNLKQRVRIGMFLAADRSVLSIIRNESGCGLMFDQRPNDLSHGTETGKCGFVELNAGGQAEIKFGDCNERLPALVSFPQFGPAQCKDCSFSHDEHVEGLLEHLKGNVASRKSEDNAAVTSKPTLYDTLEKKIGVAPLLAIAVAVVLAVSVTAAAIAAIIIFRKKHTRMSLNIPESSTTPHESTRRTTESSLGSDGENSGPTEKLIEPV